MTLAITDIIDAVSSHAAASGLFDRVEGHEPTNPPGHGLTAAVWVDKLGPARQASGLASTTARLVLNVRLYSSLLQEPGDYIDPHLTSAVDTLMGLYVSDFTLGGLVRSVDVRGAEGVSLEAEAGYLRVNGGEYRVFTIKLPVIVNDLWTEAP